MSSSAPSKAGAGAGGAASGAAADEAPTPSKISEVADLAFQLTVADEYVSPADKAAIKARVLKTVEEENMAPMYEKLCKDLGWAVDQTLLSKMKAKNDEDIKKHDERVTEAKEKFGEEEVFERLNHKAAFLARIGDNEGCLKAFEELAAAVKHLSTGQKVDVAMAKARLFLASSDWLKAKEKIQEAQDLNDKGGDWDRRNRLKVYRGLFLLTQRDFAGASSLLMDSLATFTAHELLSYEAFVFYTVLAGLKTLGSSVASGGGARTELKKKLVDSPDVLSCLSTPPPSSSSSSAPSSAALSATTSLGELLNSFYECRYKDFFRALVGEGGEGGSGGGGGVYSAIVRDRYLSKHAPFLLRELRLAAYSQFLASYKSVTLEGMAKIFGLSAPFLDAELSRFISGGKIAAKIDATAGIVETAQLDAKNAQYQQLLKQGDLLLNKVQRLSRVVAL